VRDTKKSQVFRKAPSHQSLEHDELFVIDIHDRLTAVSPTLQAYAMRYMIFTASITHDQMIERQRIMRTAAIAATAGNFSLR
jgi:hypothetical protein